MGPKEYKCPICNEIFEYMTQFSYTIFGHNLDFKPFGAASIPTPIPKCPKCDFVFFEKLFTKNDLNKLKKEFKNNDIFEKEPDMPNYYYLAKECEIAGKKTDSLIYYYTCAIWEDNKKKHFKKISEIIFDYIKRADKKDKNYYVYKLIELDYLRRLKEFDKAKDLILLLIQDKTFPVEYMPVLDKQHDLIKKKNTGEHEMPEIKKQEKIEDINESETREEQKIKDKEEELDKVIGNDCKLYGYESSMGFFYKFIDDFVYTGIINVGKTFNVTTFVKSITLDNELWKFLNTYDSYTKQPKEIYVNGVVISKHVEIKKHVLEYNEPEEAKELFKKIIEITNEDIKNYRKKVKTLADFHENIKNQDGQFLNNLIFDLIDKKYEKAFDKINEHIKKYGVGKVLRTGKSLLQHIKDECEKKVGTIKKEQPFTPIKPERKPLVTLSDTFDYGNANENQKMAISTTEGPVLITAGPGTGKTFTLVQRALFLIQEKGVKPEEIMMATFTEKAAKELITRISNTLLKKNILLNLNEMYIGTFHSICLRFIKENLEYSTIKKNYRTLDDFDQKYTIMRNMSKFEKIENIDLVLKELGIWDKAKTICKYVNNLSEEFVEPADLKKDNRPHIKALGEIMETYNAILNDGNLMDFSKLQTEAFNLINNNPAVLEKIQSKIKYLMIDEYQDTNYIQERIVFLLGQKTGNICVVGDDDQGLYRFRGATIRNILEFPNRFEKETCVQIPLVVNYRSSSDIVDFYNEWMAYPQFFEWDNYRFFKTIIPKKGNEPKCPAVLKIGGEGEEVNYHNRVLEFIIGLYDTGKITDFNQIAFLFRSVKSPKAVKLAQYLESKGVNVYSPRSDMFFERDEVKLVFGLLLYLFPQYVEKMEKKKFRFMDDELEIYLRSCIDKVNNILVSHKEMYRDILTWVKKYSIQHQMLMKSTDYAYSGLLYRMFEFRPLKSLLDTNISFSNAKDLRISRNLALLSKIITKYEYLHHINVLTPKNIEEGTERFFNQYLRFLYKGGFNEYEDDAEYAPSGCVSFLTIHQSKGMEFPIVMVGSLSSSATDKYDNIIGEVERDYFHRQPFEPRERIKYFDFWRLYYTAFSRAQNLLVLISPETKGDPNKYFKDQFNDAHSIFSKEIDIAKLEFEKIKDVNIKESYAFTSDISVYETCGVQYKFFNVLEFSPIRIGATLYGRLVHQTIEDIHKTALRGEKEIISEGNITSWFDTNYDSLSKAEHTYLNEPQLKAALKSILRYAEKHQDKWEAVVEAEVGVSLVKEDYIIDGKIDLIRSPDIDSQDVVEIIDFKSEKKPDLVKEKEKIDRYKKQLQVYAYLVEQNTGKKVNKLHLYYTGEEDGAPTISFDPSKMEIKETIKDFDHIVRKIQDRNFEHKSSSGRVCANCDFRFYCKRD